MRENEKKWDLWVIIVWLRLWMEIWLMQSGFCFPIAMDTLLFDGWVILGTILDILIEHNVCY